MSKFVVRDIVQLISRADDDVVRSWLDHIEDIERVRLDLVDRADFPDKELVREEDDRPWHVSAEDLEAVVVEAGDLQVGVGRVKFGFCKVKNSGRSFDLEVVSVLGVLEDLEVR